MNNLRPLLRLTLLAAFALVIGSSAPAQSRPEVIKVEPPNWWAGHSVNPVRVMVRGRNLRGARVQAAGAGLRVVGMPKVNDRGTYLFVDVSVAPSAQPGARRLRLTTASGTVDAPFEITAALPRANRFAGISTDDVIYLLMPDRFSNGDRQNDDPAKSRGLLDRSKPRYYHGGDLRGVINRLPYLKDLGVTALWLNPWYDNNDGLNEVEKYDGKPITDYHGYGAVDFYAVDEHFGDLSTLREFVDAAHRAGIKVVQDQVANHTGPYHPWVKDSPTPTWFNGTEADHINETWQTWTLQDPHATPEVHRPILDGWFLNILPDLNQNDPEVAKYIIQNTLWWAGMTGLDAIRQDTLPYVPRRFWRDWMAAIKREYPNMNVVGETLDGDPAIVSFFQGGAKRFDGIDSGIDTEFDFPLYYPIRDAFAKNRNLKPVPQMLARDHLYANPGVLVTHLGLHDVPRFMGEEGATHEGLMLAQTFVLTTRGIPLLYYGDEIAMEGGNDPDNRRDFPGDFPGDRRNAFTEQGRSEKERKVYDHVRRVARLRAELEPLRRGKLVTLGFTEQQYAYARTTPRGSVIVVINNEGRRADFEFDVTPLRLREGARLSDRLNVTDDARVSGATVRVKMPARSASIFTVN
ncbi:MAG TPA: alpha-amylase family glycosyl hydrolase [Blastocatellia bacterium]|nr:alpha-amylase family glycosyl hydrolase [Blastocatellia bacterium]